MGESPETETQPIRKQGLLYTNSDLTNRLVSGLYQMMKNKQFCDVVFSIGKFEVPAHRNVLACASPYLNSLFSKPQQEESQERVTIEFEEHQVKKECLKLIIDYIYTARLEVPDHLVVETYIAASRLQITDARRACANYLLSNLDISNCLLLRSTPETEHEKSLSAALDAFIAEKIKNIVSDGALKVAQLPSITVELLQSTIEDAKAVQIAPLADLILDWIKRDTAGEADLDAMTERTHLLYCSNDNIIHDCSDIEDTDTESELIQDYKKMAKRHVAQNKSRHRRRATPTKPVRFLIYSRRASDMKAENEEQGVEERKWRIVAYTEVGDLAYVALAMLDGRLFKVSVSIRVQSLNTNTPSRPIPLDVSEIPLPRMSSNRGALGATVLNDCIVVMGGNDRGECMKSGEIYDPITNAWSPCISMGTPRARFGLAASDGTLYAIGGSDGRGELASVEYLAPGATQWKYHTKLPSGKSQFSVAVLNGLLYCVGGNTTQGQAASTQCEVFDPKLGTWTEIDSLHDGRCNLGLVTFRDELWAVGGSNAWAAIPTVEIYNPRSGKWRVHPDPLPNCRRGCAVVELNGKVWVLGGFDGQNTLSSTEVYDPVKKTWSSGPPMNTPRVNLAAVVVSGRIHVIGGFSGKNFLNSMEVYDSLRNEWATTVPYPRCELSHRTIAEDETEEKSIASTTDEGSSTGGDLKNEEINDDCFVNGDSSIGTEL